MLKIILIVILIFFSIEKTYAEIISGQVNKTLLNYNSGVVIDSETGQAIPGAIITFPSKGIKFRNNSSGGFDVDFIIEKPTIMGVFADGYQPFSCTINAISPKSPLKAIILKKSRGELVIDSEMHHLGDDKFSKTSANANDFCINSEGPVFSKKFSMQNISNLRDMILRIGSIIGIDTKIARKLGQSIIKTSHSSPVKIFVNSQKIGEIWTNGNDKVFKIPKEILRPGYNNFIRIETGLNLNFESSTDYDDIEFMNVFLE